MRNLFFAGLMGIFLQSSLFSSNDIIPRQKLFTKPSCIAIKLSPDEKRLAYVGADREGTMNLFCSPDLSLNAKKATHFSSPEIRAFHWSATGKKIVLLKDNGGTKQFHLYVLDVDSFELKDLTQAYDNINAKIFQMSSTENKAVVGINNRNPKFHDLFLADFDNNSLTHLLENDDYINFLFDDNLQVVLKIRMNKDSSLTFLDKEGKTFAEVCAEDAFNTECLRYVASDNSLYLMDNRGCNTTKLKKITLDEKKQETVLGHDAKSDIQDVLFVDAKPIAFSTYYTEKTWHPLDAKTKTEIDYLLSKFSRNISIANQNKDGKFWIVTNSIPEKGNDFWLYNRASKELSLLFSHPNIKNLAKTHPLIIPSQDGMELVSYLTLPKSLDIGGKTNKPLPLVVIPHGGPFKARDFYNYSPYHQWLANRGYAVLSVNFRLSSGFGKNFVNAGNGQWGKNAHRDILDAVKWCVDNKIADNDKIAVFGTSYGAYEALTSLTLSPTRFACAVAICAPANLKTVLQKTPFYWELPTAPLSDKMAFFTSNAFYISMGGNPNNPSDIPYLDECSPINYVDKIQRPCLLVHGVNDPIVAASESDQIFETMKEKKLPVIYISFPDEGHGVSKFANSMCYLAYSEWLFAQILGGKYEPLSESELRESSAKIQSSGLSLNAVFKPACKSKTAEPARTR
jgi:dipeptidyl aminopeptidase/acylaminoacyl peptidase